MKGFGSKGTLQPSLMAQVRSLEPKWWGESLNLQKFFSDLQMLTLAFSTFTQKKITKWKFQTNYNIVSCPLCVDGQLLRSLTRVFEWQGKKYDSRPPVCKEIALQAADGCGPAVFPPAEILLNLIERGRVHEPLQRNLISISVHLIS